MHNILSQILEKKGIRNFDELKEAEKATYKAWGEVLSRPDVSIEDLKRLLPIELAKARKELSNYENSSTKDLYCKAYVRVLEVLTTLIISPAKEREALANRLKKEHGL